MERWDHVASPGGGAGARLCSESIKTLRGGWSRRESLWFLSGPTLTMKEKQVGGAGPRMPCWDWTASVTAGRGKWRMAQVWDHVAETWMPSRQGSYPVCSLPSVQGPKFI